MPSGFQSGIKIVKGFDITANQTTELLLDFDATKSIVEPGTNNKWLLKPTIKVLSTTEYALIEGSAGAPGVLISAQVYSAAAPDLEDQVTVEAATVSDATGHYKLLVEPGDYTVVGYKDGNLPFYTTTKLHVTPGTVFAVNFTLATAASTGSVTGTITISQADQEQYATVSIRQNATVNTTPPSPPGESSPPSPPTTTTEQIEIKSLNVADGGTFTAGLPVGSYAAVISTFGKTTIGPTTLSVAPSPAVTNLGTINFP